MGQAKNAEIVNVLRRQGFQIPDGFDTTGNQRGEFFARLTQLLDPSGSQNFVSAFGKARDIAGKLADIPDNASPHDRLFGTLQAWGVSKTQMGQIAKDTDNRAKAAGRGLKFNDQDYGAAVADILGENTPIFQQVMGHAGWAAMPGQAGVWAPTYGDPTKPLGSPGLIAPAQPATPGGAVPAGGLAQQAQKAAPAPAAAPGAAPPGPAPAAPGGGDPAVRALQESLNAKGAKLTVDGIMGPATKAAQTKFGGAPGAGTTAPPATDLGGMTGLPANASDAQIAAYFAGHYGYGKWAWDDPELQGVLKNIAKNPSGWTVDAVKGALTNTQWWENNGLTVATFLEKQTSSPADSQRDVKAKADDIAAYAHNFGIVIPPDRLNSMATDALKFGWDDTTLHGAVANEFHYTAGATDSPFVSSLRQSAKDQLVPLTDSAIQQWGTDIASGRMTQADWDTYLKDQAKSKYPGLAGYLDSGGTMKTFVAPYAKSIGDTLEINPDSIDFTDPKYAPILNQVDPKTGNLQVMSLAETQTWARQQPGWATTKNANQITSSLGEKLLQTFGQVK